MLKEGHQVYSGRDVVVLRNVEAGLQLTQMITTSFGPLGMNKLVVNHLGKIIVTSDANTVVQALEIEHPAAKLIQMAAQQQELECGDATNLCVSICGQMLQQAKLLLTDMGLCPADIVRGYELAWKFLEQQWKMQDSQADSPLVAYRLDVTNTELLNQDLEHRVITPVIMTKQFGSHTVLAPLIAKACQMVRYQDASTRRPTVQAETVRTLKLLGGRLEDSYCVAGHVLAQGPVNWGDLRQFVPTNSEGTTLENVKLVVFACGVEASSTEAKGTVLMKTADDLLNYNKSEEMKLQEIIESIVAVDAKALKVVVTGGHVSEMALHYLTKNQIWCWKIGSKWELRRLCQATGATALTRLGPPTADELGFCTKIAIQQVGITGNSESQKTISIFEQKGEESSATSTTPTRSKPSSLATIVLRSSTSSFLQDLERAVEDGVRAVQQALQHPTLCYGGGCTELHLSRLLHQQAMVSPGLEQYALRGMAKTLEWVARSLAESAVGPTQATATLSSLLAAHGSGPVVTTTTTSSTNTTSNSKQGDNVISDVGVWIKDDPLALDDDDNEATALIASMKEHCLYDVIHTKASALRLAVDAAITILKVDQIIMARASGGPQLTAK